MPDTELKRLKLVCRSSALPETVRSDLAAAFDVEFLPADHAVDQLPSADALLVTIDSPLRAAEISALPSSIGAIATYSVGLDHIDLRAAAARGLRVFNTPGVLAESVADAAMFLVLGAARRATESIDLVRGEWPGWHADQLNGVELAGKVLGLFGMGEIGRRIAVRARAFGMSIIYSALAPVADEAGKADFIDDPDRLFAESDVLVLVAPATPETRGFADAKRLATARPSLIVVNIGRGELVVDQALIDALRSGTIRAAALDVFNGEPAFDRRYLELPNVFLTPHIGSSTIEARRRMAQVLISALKLWRAGGHPSN